MKPLQTFSVVAPGFQGLNTQDSSVTLESGFALEAWNCVIDKQGRLSSRKGYVTRSAVNADLGNNPVKALYEFVKNDGTTEILSAGNNKLFRGTATLTNITPGGGYVISNSNWLFANLNSNSYLFQSGQEPLIYSDIGSGYVMTAMTAYPGYVAPSVGITWANVKTGISALGRIWCATDQVVYFSDLLQGWVWNTGTSGSLDVSRVWPDGTDTIQSVFVHNNFLIIFGRRSIIVYSGADNPANLRLEDTVVGTGCISQQTVQAIGTDVIFMSDNGLRSFSRVIQEQSMPMRDLSKNVRDDFLQSVLNENVADLRSVYFERDALYLIVCPSIDQVWCFDTRVSLPDGSLRATRWDKAVYTAFVATRDRRLYLGISGFLAEYSGYNDGTARYTMKYRSNYFDMGDTNTTVIPKKLSMVVVTANDQSFVFKWGFDYSPLLESEAAQYEGLGVFEYGVAEYGVAEYSTGETLGGIDVNPGGDGNILQVGFDSEINGARVSVQKFSVYVKKWKGLMSNYTKLVDYASKDALTPGDPNKVVRGTEIDAEFEAVETAVSSKADLISPAFGGSPTAPTPAINADNTLLATTAFVRDIVPAGVILMWSGSVATIPAGWTLCDGTASTPDLRDRFIVGAGSTYSVGAAAGSKDAVVVDHTHTATSVVTDPGHTHAIGYNNVTGGGAALDRLTLGGSTATTPSTTGITVATTVTNTGVSGVNANLPPYFALCYIMKT